MTDSAKHHHLEIKEGDATVAADVTIAPEEGPGQGTAQTSVHAVSGHIPPGRRASLVDAVMDLPDVQGSARLEAAVPLGDSETLERLRERSENASIRAAGAVRCSTPTSPIYRSRRPFRPRRPSRPTHPPFRARRAS